jgi:D-amino-acid oxidase
VLPARELPGNGRGEIKWGCEYRAWILNSPVYLTWLERKLQLRGVTIVRHALGAIEEAVFVARSELDKPELEPLAVVNASGMGFADPERYPSREQFLLVSNSCSETISHHGADGTSTVIIPRPLDGGTLIGGSKGESN